MSGSRFRGGATGGGLGGGRGPGNAAVGLLAAMAGLVLMAAGRGASAQQPTPPAGEEPAARPAPAAGEILPLSLKFRFLERYGLNEDLERPDLLVAYQVGSIMTHRREVEKPRGAPDRQEGTQRVVYTERPVRVGRLGEALDTIRRYDRFQIVGDVATDPRAAALLQGLTLWYHPRIGASPELICLTPNRSIRQVEYDNVLGQVYFPRLVLLLPPQPVRVKDAWPIPRAAARVLMTRVPEEGDLQLEGRLESVERSADGTSTATIDIAGELAFEDGDGAVRARLSFTFLPLPAAQAGAAAAGPGPSGRAGAARDPELLEARGSFTKLVMSLRKAMPLDEVGRLQEIRTGELHLQRRKVTSDAAALPLLEKPPAPDVANCWLVYDDPQGRFHFRHPQELAIQINEPDALALGQVRPDGKMDSVIIGNVPRDPDANRDRRYTDPQAFVQHRKQEWDRKGLGVISGEMGWLPDRDWSPLKRRVFRFEAAHSPEGSPRVYLDEYLVLLAQGEHFTIRAMTNRDDHLAFRNQTEQMIRSLGVGPSSVGAGGAAQPTAAPASPAAAAAPTRPAPARDLPAPPPVPRLDRRP